MRRTPEGARRAGRWRRGFVAAAVLCAVGFAVQLSRGEVAPGNVWGMTWGALATALLLGAALLGLRRRAPGVASRRGLGSARAWLDFHLWGGALFLLLMLMHSGFRLPTGVFSWWLFGLSLWTVLSGLGGLALERWIPRVLSSGLGIEVLYERIPELVDDIRARAEALAASCGDAVQALYARSVAPALAGPSHRLIFYLDVTGGIQRRLTAFDYLRRRLPAAERDKLEQLARLYRTKLEIDAHYTLQRALRLWLWLHLPPSLLLLTLVVIHVAAVLYY